MVNVPLIQGNSVQEINTSIIAIKKAQKELEMLNRQVDEKIKALNLALSGGVGKYIQSISQTEGQIAVEVGELTDTIASGNTQPATSNALSHILCFSSSGRTLTGAALQTGIIIRVMFTSQQNGSNTSTAFTITYNGTSYTVKASKNGSLSNFVANKINGSYIYCQAYTTLELLFDGTQFIIMGNPVVISSADYTIYTDGSIKYSKSNILHGVTVWTVFNGTCDATLMGLSGLIRVSAVQNGNVFGQVIGCYGNFNGAFRTANNQIFLGEGTNNKFTIENNTVNVQITPNYGGTRYEFVRLR